MAVTVHCRGCGAVFNGGFSGMPVNPGVLVWVIVCWHTRFDGLCRACRGEVVPA